jgi:hypothetical protein
MVPGGITIPELLEIIASAGGLGKILRIRKLADERRRRGTTRLPRRKRKSTADLSSLRGWLSGVPEPRAGTWGQALHVLRAACLFAHRLRHSFSSPQVPDHTWGGIRYKNSKEARWNSSDSHGGAGLSGLVRSKVPRKTQVRFQNRFAESTVGLPARLLKACPTLPPQRGIDMVVLFRRVRLAIAASTIAGPRRNLRLSFVIRAQSGPATCPPDKAGTAG